MNGKQLVRKVNKVLIIKDRAIMHYRNLFEISMLMNVILILIGILILRS